MCRGGRGLRRQSAELLTLVKVQPPAPMVFEVLFLTYERSLEWLRAKVKAMRSFGGSLLGYVGLPLEVKGNVLRLDSNENFLWMLVFEAGFCGGFG